MVALNVLICCARDLIKSLNNYVPKIVEELPIHQLHPVLRNNHQRFLQILKNQFKLAFLLQSPLHLLN